MPQAQTIDLSAGLTPKIDLSAGLVATPRPAAKIDLSAGLVPADPLANNPAFLASQQEAKQQITSQPMHGGLYIAGPAEQARIEGKPAPAIRAYVNMGEEHELAEGAPVAAPAMASIGAAELLPEGAPWVAKMAAAGAFSGATGEVASQARREQNPIAPTSLKQDVESAGIGAVTAPVLGAALLGLSKFLPKGAVADTSREVSADAIGPRTPATTAAAPASATPPVSSARHAEAAASASRLGPEFTEGENGYLANQMRAVLRNPQATEEERAVAQSHLDSLREQSAREAASKILPHDTPIETHEAVAQALGADAANRIAKNTATLKQVLQPAMVGSAEDVDASLNAAADMLERNPDARMRGSVSDAQTIRLAQNTGLDAASLLSAKSGQAFSDAEVVAANTLLEHSVDRTLQVAKDVQSGAADPDTFFAAMAKHAEIDDAVARKVGSEAGRALRARQINAPDYGGEGAGTRPQALARSAFKLLTNLPEDVKRQAAAEFVKIPQDNTRALAKFIRDYTRFSTGKGWWGRLADMAYEIRINSLLSGSASLKKLASDTSMAVLAPIEKGLPILQGKSSALHEAASMAHGFFAGVPDAMRAFGESWETELGSSSEFEPRSFAIPGSTGRVIRVPSRLVSAVNDMVHSLQRSGSIYAQAYKMAAREGLSGDALSSRVAELAANPSDSMLKAANLSAKERTFQKSMTGDRFGSWLRQGQNLPGVRWLVPFLKTPYNLFKLGVDFTPFGVPKGMYKLLTEGADAATPTLMRNTIGGVVSMYGLHLAAQGRLSGIGPSNPQQRAALEATGWQPYSIKIGDHWVSYRYLQPLATSLMTVGSGYDSVRYDHKPQESILAGLSHAGLQITKSEFDLLPFVDQLAGLSSIARGGHASASAILRAVQSEVGSLIPTGLSDFARAVDRAYRNPQGIRQELESRIPGLTSRVPPRVDASGQTEMRPVSALGGFNPFPASPVRNDPVLSQLAQLGITTENAPKKATASRYGVPSGGKAPSLDLTPNESAAIQRQEQSEFYARAQRLMQSSDWKSSTDAQHKKMLKEIREQVERNRYSRVQEMRTNSRGPMHVVQRRP